MSLEATLRASTAADGITFFLSSKNLEHLKNFYFPIGLK